ncbi:MAG TPA: hypothetical protein VIH45_09420 [Desulfuromonadaceae bacterium]
MTGVAGCSGGGGGSPAATAISGTAAAGILANGTASVYAIDANGTRGTTPLVTVPIDANGKYSASLGTYSGAVQVEVTGTYSDEATGGPVSITAAKPLHAFLDVVDNGANNNRVVSVTPFTELAWRKASANGTAATPPAAIASANALVSSIFRINSIVATEPVSLDNTSMAGASLQAQAYTLALAALSQMTKPASGAATFSQMDGLVDTLAAEAQGAETSGSMSAGTATAFATALSNVPLASGYSSAAGMLYGVGMKSQKITLATSGQLPPGTKIYAVQGTISLPLDAATNLPKVSLSAVSTGQMLSNAFLLSGTASSMANLLPIANYLASQHQVKFAVVFDVTKQGMDIGPFATMAYDVVPGATVTAADFSVAASSVKDANGATISGISVVVN